MHKDKHVFWLEWKRIFSERTVLILLIILFVSNAVFLIFTLDRNMKYDTIIIFGKRYDELLQPFQGEVREETARQAVSLWENLKALLDKGNKTWVDEAGKEQWLFRDEAILKRVVEEMKYCYLYPVAMENSLEKAEAIGGGYSNFRRIYDNRFISTYHKNFGVEPFLQYNISSCLVVLLAFYVILPVWKTQEDNFQSYMHRQGSSFKRHIKSIWCTSSMYLAVVLLVFRIQDFLVVHYYLGMGDLRNPLYASADFQNSIFNGSTLSFLLYDYLCKYLFVLITLSLFLFCSFFFRKKWLSYILAACFFPLIIFLQSMRESLLNPLSHLNVSRTFRSPWTSQIQSLAFYPCSLLLIVVIVAVIEVLISVFILNKGVNHVIRRNQKS